jgi:hypothetical protein
MWCGPSAMLAKIGFPLTTNSLQAGQYEGFSYLGTATLIMMLLMIMASIIIFLRQRKEYFKRMMFFRESSLVLRNELFRYPIMMCMATFFLFILSWGYIVHIAGVRFDGILTPSFLIATIWPKFMFVRTMGRLAIPLMLFVTVAVVVIFGRMMRVAVMKRTVAGGLIFGLVMVAITALHIYEIHGYLEPPGAIVKGDCLAKVFGKDDVAIISEVTGRKKAIIAAPAIRSNDQWLVLCYSLAYYAKIPLNGYYSGLGVNPAYIRQNVMDTEDVMSGKIKSIKARYGNIVIAAPPQIAETIMQSADMPLNLHRMKNQGIVLMTL